MAVCHQNLNLFRSNCSLNPSSNDQIHGTNLPKASVSFSSSHDTSKTSPFGFRSQNRSLSQLFPENNFHFLAPNSNARRSNLVSVKASSSSRYNVVITGSTKGVGLELAREFLRSGDKVVICSRSEERVEKVSKDLNGEFPDRVWGISCNVSKSGDVETLSSFACEKMGSIDIWINNAGSNAYTYAPLVETDESSIIEIVETNLLGVMLCCRQAIKVMKDQKGGGHIFNMDGAGADGNATPRFAAYGATKRSLAQFTKSLQSELKMLGIKNVVVHNLSPGMVTTELLMSGGDTPSAKFFINILAEPANEVAQFLVPRVRDVLLSAKNSSTYIKFLTPPKAYSQIFARILFKARKDKYIPEDP